MRSAVRVAALLRRALEPGGIDEAAVGRGYGDVLELVVDRHAALGDMSQATSQQ